MPLFTSATITRFSEEGEADFATSFPCIIKRVALTIVGGTSTYSLSDDVLSIRRVSYLGTKVVPLPHRGMRQSFEGATQTGKPFWYVYNNIGQNQIKLFPTPPTSITGGTANLYGSEIANKVIVEYWQAPSSTYLIPAYIRRRLLKAYVLHSCFAIEGQGQNLKNTVYFTKKYEFLKAKYGQLLQDLHNKPRKLMISNYSSSNFPGQPILPIARFGTSVDTGE